MLAKKILGVLMIAGGIVAGVWIDVVFFFVGGIEEIIRGFQAHPNSGHDIAWGFVRTIAFSGLGLAAAIFLLVIPGLFLLTTKHRGRPWNRPVKAR